MNIHRLEILLLHELVIFFLHDACILIICTWSYYWFDPNTVGPSQAICLENICVVDGFWTFVSTFSRCGWTWRTYKRWRKIFKISESAILLGDIMELQDFLTRITRSSHMNFYFVNFFYSGLVTHTISSLSNIMAYWQEKNSLHKK